MMELNEQQLTALVVNTVREAISSKNTEDELEALRTKNAELEEKLSAFEKKEGEGENADGEGEELTEEEKEAATLENAKPSQEMVKTFSTVLNVDFGAKTPSFTALATLAGIKEPDPAARIAAVNAKFAELQKNAPKEKDTASAHNVAGEAF
jgi:uncharacterized protein YigA (DUF484 family)